MINRGISEINCTGCRACEQLCPQRCISMKADAEGFLVPAIDNNVCTNCGLCAKRCPSNIIDFTENKHVAKVYAAKINDTNILMKSASGGIFPAIALTALQEDETHIFGAAYDDNLNVIHICINSENELYKLQNSKYVQSDVNDTYSQVKKLLGLNKKVIYTGTPCQIAGLKAFLNDDSENLLTVDLICHGVPSPLMFKKYIGWLSKKRRSKIHNYTFRSKEKSGWGLAYAYAYAYAYGTCYGISGNDPYYRNFLSANTYRDVCYKCKYANTNRVSDITIGDYWGIEKYHPEFLDKNGVSVVLLNNVKAEAFFEKMKSAISFLESDIEKAATDNYNLKKPTKRNNNRNTIYKGINEMSDYAYIQKKLNNISYYYLKCKLSPMLPPSFKNIFKKMLKQ